MRSLQEELKKQKPFTVPEQEAYLNLVRTACELGGGWCELFKSRGISQQQYNVLRILRGAGDPGLPSQEIGERMVTRVPDVTRLVDRLEEAGFVQRSKVPGDRRVVLVTLTDKARKLLEELDEPVIQLHIRQLGHLSREELTELSRLLTKARNPGVHQRPAEGSPQPEQGQSA